MTAHQFNGAVDRLMRLRRLRGARRVVIPDVEIRPGVVTPEMCVRRICRALEVDTDVVMSDAKTRHIVYVRFIISHVLRNEYSLTLIRIGQIMGRSHDAVINHLRQFDNLVETRNKQFLEMLKKTKMI